MHFPVKLSWSQVLYTLPAQVFVAASVVYTSQSSFHVCKCCIHCPLVMFVVLACARICLLSQVLYTLPARVRRFVICSPFLFENDFIRRFRHLGPVCYSRSITYPLKPRRLKVIKRIPWNAESGASSPCSFAHNDTFSSLSRPARGL